MARIRITVELDDNPNPLIRTFDIPPEELAEEREYGMEEDYLQELAWNLVLDKMIGVDWVLIEESDGHL